MLQAFNHNTRKWKKLHVYHVKATAASAQEESVIS
jgi:hypothetical protein